jgi:hypothetical protein
MNQNVSTGSTTAMNFGAPAEEISRRAYEIWESEGRPGGCDLRHWLQAEQELSARPTNRGGEGSHGGESSGSRDTGTDQPLQGTRSGGVQRNTQQAGKRKPSHAPMM